MKTTRGSERRPNEVTIAEIRGALKAIGAERRRLGRELRESRSHGGTTAGSRTKGDELPHSRRVRK